MSTVVGPFNIVDLVLLAMALFVAWSGWRQGLISGVLSFVGFVGGSIGGILLAPQVLKWLGLSGGVGLVVAIAIVLFVAGVGNAVLVTLGRLLRDRLTWKPIRALDSAGGAMFGVLTLTVMAWLLASALVVLPDVGLAQQVRSSAVLDTVDQHVPQDARTWVSELGAMLDNTGLPQVFAGLGVEPIAPVGPPDPVLLQNPAVRRAWNSLVKVEGDAQACGTQIDGSGFVFAADHVMTNAHVVAGTSRLTVQTRGTGTRYPATVVYLDPEVDVAVLYVPGLDAPALSFAGPAASGANAVVVGFPGGGKLTAVPARIRSTINARGKDIYGANDVIRQIYSLRSIVRPGDSGGPLLSPSGDVDGVVFAASVDDSDTGYALTASQVYPAAVAGRTATSAVATGSCHTD